MDTDEDSGAREMGEGEGEGEGEEEVGSQDGLEEEEVGDEVSSEREGEREMKEPRDLVKVRVLEYEKLEEDFIYTLEVMLHTVFIAMVTDPLLWQLYLLIWQPCRW